MKFKYLILFIFVFVQCIGQTKEKTDLQKDKLKGPVASTKQYSVDASDNTAFLESITYYSKAGMKTKYIPFEKDYGYNPIKVTDSVIYSYDDKNRITQYNHYEKHNGGREIYRIRKDYYTYNDKCKKKSSTKTIFSSTLSDKTIKTDGWNEIFQYNNKCKLTFRKEVGRGTENTTTNEYNIDGKLIKSSFKYVNDLKPYKVKSYLYNEDNKKITYLEYNPEKGVFRNKEIQYFDKSDNLVKIEMYKPPKWGGSITFSKGSNVEPKNMIFTKSYVYDKQNRLVKEIHLDKDRKGIFKLEAIYSGNTTTKTLYKSSKFIRREVGFYKNGKVIEVKIYNRKKSKKPEIVDKWNYLYNGKLKSKTEKNKKQTKVEEWNYLKNGNLESKKSYYLKKKKPIYLYTYEYDSYGNNTSKKSFINNKLEDFDKNEYTYYK